MGDGVVQLSSKSHPESILGSLHQLRLQGQLSDITVHVSDQGDEEDFQAHQVILAASSGYFKKILLSPDSAPPTNPVVLNMHTTDFSNFLDFVYTGKVEVPRDKVDGVREAASLLECEDLLEVCSRVLQAEELKDTEQTSSLSPSHDTEGLHNTGKKKLTKRGTLKRQRSPRTSGRLGCKKLKQMDIGHEETSPDKVGIRRLSIRVARRHASVGTKRGKIKETSREQYEYSQGTTDRGQGDGADSPSRAEREEDEGLLVPSVSWDVVDGDNSEEEEEEDEHVPEDDPGDPLYLSLDDEKEEDAPTTSRRSSKAQFYCDNCQRSFHYERSYLKHISTYHGEKTEVIYRCETCQQTFANRGNLKIHEKHVHSDERLFACQVCSKSFKRKKDVVRHQRMVHEGGGQRHICPDCGKTLSSKTALTLHERTHTGAKPYECLKCGARFTQRSALKMHNRTHTGEKPFACDQCDARFTQKHMLCYHKRSHTGEKPFMCEACGKSFASKEYLRHHSNIHTGSKPHKCDLCGRGFAQRNSLHQHLKIHTGERPYSCKECDKQFTQLNALQRHQRIHTGEKPYMCGLCNRTFTDKSTVRRHTMTHDTDAPWKNYLVVLEGNVEGKKPKVSPKVKADKSEGQELKAEVAASGAKAQTEAVAVPAEPVAISADWANPGTIALVSHNALGSFTVIQTEMPPGTQLQPLVTTDGTGASVISLDGSAISVPFSLPVSMAHSIPVSSSSISVPVSLTVPVSEAILASGTPPVSTAPLLETAETIPDSVVEAAAANKAGVVDPDIKTVITPGKEDSVKQPPAIPGDEQQRPPEEMSTGEAASEESPEDAV